MTVWAHHPAIQTLFIFQMHFGWTIIFEPHLSIWGIILSEDALRSVEHIDGQWRLFPHTTNLQQTSLKSSWQKYGKSFKPNYFQISPVVYWNSLNNWKRTTKCGFRGDVPNRASIIPLHLAKIKALYYNHYYTHWYSIFITKYIPVCSKVLNKQIYIQTIYKKYQ